MDVGAMSLSWPAACIAVRPEAGRSYRAPTLGGTSEDALARGTGVASAEYLPGVRLVRAFNAISNRSVDSKAHRPGEKVAIPIAGDDEEAVRIASEFVTDAGFDPVVVGGLSRARDFDQGSAVYVKDMTAAELRAALGL